MDDKVKIDYFAVSLPDLTIFDDDLDLRNKVHCHYLLALGYTGLQDKKMADQHLNALFKLDASHLDANMLLHLPVASLSVTI